jgi:hypothetical protein
MLPKAKVTYDDQSITEFRKTASQWIAQFTFVAEVLLIFWLLWRGFKGFEKELSVAGATL